MIQVTEREKGMLFGAMCLLIAAIAIKCSSNFQKVSIKQDEKIAEQTKTIKKMDNIIKQQEGTIGTQVKTIKQQEVKIGTQEQLIKLKSDTLKQRFDVIMLQDKSMKQQTETIKGQKEIIYDLKRFINTETLNSYERWRQSKGLPSIL